MLSLLITLPILGILSILIIPEYKTDLIKQTAFLFSLITFIFSIFLWIFFDNSTSKFQFIECFDWMSLFNIHFFLGIDGISLFFVILSTFLVSICILNSWSSVKKHLKKYYICFLLMDLFLIIVFSVLDVVVFYIFFESILMIYSSLSSYQNIRFSLLKLIFLIFN